MKLELSLFHYYRVKRGQTLKRIAKAYSLPVSVLVKENALTAEVEEGQVICIPTRTHPLYRVCGGESKEKLCGSEEAFEKRNGTPYLYPEQEILL